MNLDIALGVIAAGALMYGIHKGFIAQLASIGGLIIGIVACRLFHQQAGDFIMSHFANICTSHTAATVIGCVALFMVIYFSINAFACILRRITHALCAGWIDRLLGGIASVFKWLLFSSVILNIWHYISPDSSAFSTSQMTNGKPVEIVMKLAPGIFGIVSEQLTLSDC